MKQHRRRKLVGLFGRGVGDAESLVNPRSSPDAMSAIHHARANNCKSAMKALYDASPQAQCRRENFACIDKAEKDFKMASIIVAQHCGRDVGKRGSSKYGVFYRRGGSGKKTIIPGFGRARSRR